MSFAELHWTCGHATMSPVIGTSHDNPRRDTPCFDCRQQNHQATAAQQNTARTRAQATCGPLATPAQVRYLLDLIQRTPTLPADTPTTRQEIELLPRDVASAHIDRLKATPRQAAGQTAGTAGTATSTAIAPVTTAKRQTRARRVTRPTFRCECASGRYGGVCTC